jgi:hypothetical protein
MVSLFEIKEGERFILDGEIYRLITHDTSGSLSAGPGCERENDKEIVCFSYIAWGKDAKVTQVERV